MDWFLHADPERWLIAAMVLARVLGLVMVAPVFAATELPVRFRLLLAGALALVILPTQAAAATPAPAGWPALGVSLGGEALIGCSLGLGVAILLAGFEMAGSMIANSSGLSMAEVFDPAQGVEVSVFSRLLSLLGIAVFFAIGGHRMLLAGLLETFRAMPVGAGPDPDALAEAAVTLVSQSFALGLRASIPIVAALLVANLAIGLIGRTLPQVNIFLVGMGVNSLLALGGLVLGLGAAAYAFQGQIEPTIETLVQAMR